MTAISFLLSLNISTAWAVTCNFTPDPNNAGKYSLEIKGDSGGNVFSGCNNGFPDGISAWWQVSSKITSATLDKNITSIGNYAFQNARSLTSITIPEGVTSIGNNTFLNASSLTSITLPEGLTSIGESAFRGTSSLTSITLPKGVTSIEYGAFQNARSLTSITIPEGVTSIGDNAFDNTSSLKSITIPDSVTSIGDDAFANTSSLKSITIPDSVTSIGGSAFYNTGLTSITLPEGLTSIGDRAFYRTSSLTSITIPESVTSIGRDAFEEASGLESIIIPDNINTADWNAKVFRYLPKGVNIVCQGGLNTCYEKLAKYFSVNDPRCPANATCNCSSGCIDSSRISEATSASQCTGNYGWSGAGCSRKNADGSVDCASGFVEWDNKCWSEYPFAKKRWTPAEASQWLHDGNDNFVVITFKK